MESNPMFNSFGKMVAAAARDKEVVGASLQDQTRKDLLERKEALKAKIGRNSVANIAADSANAASSTTAAASADPSLAERYAEDRQALKNAKAALEQKEHELEKANSEVTQLRDRLKKSTTELQEVKKNASNARILEEESARIREQLESLQLDKEIAEGSMEELKSELDSYKETSKRLETELEMVKQRSHASQQEVGFTSFLFFVVGRHEPYQLESFSSCVLCPLTSKRRRTWSRRTRPWRMLCAK